MQKTDTRQNKRQGEEGFPDDAHRSFLQHSIHVAYPLLTLFITRVAEPVPTSITRSVIVCLI